MACDGTLRCAGWRDEVLDGVDVLEEPCLRQNHSGSTLSVVSNGESRHCETIAIEPQSNGLILVSGLGFWAISPDGPHLARIHCQVSCGWLVGDPHELTHSIPSISLSHQ